jgi:hypothetical protein
MLKKSNFSKEKSPIYDSTEEASSPKQVLSQRSCGSGMKIWDVYWILDFFHPGSRILDSITQIRRGI